MTQQEIVAAIQAGKLQFQENNIHGNPYLRLLRYEVEAFVLDNSGEEDLQMKKLQKELADLDKEGRKLKNRLKAIELRRVELMKEVNDQHYTGRFKHVK